VFNVMPWRRDIVGSLLQCDYIGFHIPRQAENFVDVARGVAPLQACWRSKQLRAALPDLRLRGRAGRDDDGDRGAWPAGSASARTRSGWTCSRIGRTILADPQDSRSPDRTGCAANWRASRAILSVERLDYTKGTLEKLLAFEQLLEQLRGDCGLR
jgi:trehalose-6-phosphate synthase